jgi:hypothetical protein
MKRIMSALSLSLCVLAGCASGAPEPGDAGEPTTSAASSALSNTCANQCTATQASCEATCERFPNPNCLPRCDTRFATCMQTCGCPFNHDYDVVSFDHASPTSNTVCIGTSSSATTNRVYTVYNRTDHMRETLQCDGSTTLTLLSSSVAAGDSCVAPVPPPSGCSQNVVSPAGFVACP